MFSLTEPTRILWRQRDRSARAEKADRSLLRRAGAVSGAVGRACGSGFAAILSAMVQWRLRQAEQIIRQHRHLIHEAQAYHACGATRRQREAATGAAR